LLIVDQTEELLGYGRSEEADRFLRLLRSALEAGGSRLIALATMRSDFLGEFQTQRSLRDLAYETVTVGPMSARNLPQIIERPAEVAGITLGPGLVATMLQDAETKDALPLLAFTLRELYERYGDDRRLQLEEYQQLGGLEGSVRRAADGVIEAARPSEAELEELRSAFVPAMVRINEEGQYARRRAVRADLPPRVQGLLQRFVDARLLVADRDEAGQETLEVAHEALLRAWPRLRGWLEEDQDSLRLRETVRRAAQEWNQRGRGADWLDHRGSRLEAVEALMREPRFALKDEAERHYLQACLERRRREREEAEAAARAEKDRLAAEARAARQIARRTLIGAVASLCLALAAGAVGYVAYQNRLVAEQNALEAERQRDVAAHQRDLAEKALAARKRAESTRLAALSQQQSLDDPKLGLQLALLALPDAAAGSSDRPDTDAAAAALASAVLRDHEMVALRGHDGAVLSADFSPDGALVVTASTDGSARVWVPATGKQQAVLQGHTGAVYAARFSPDGKQAVTASADQTARIWDAATGASLTVLEGHQGDVYTAEFSPGGARVVTASDDATARLWDAMSGEVQAVLRGHQEWLWGAWFSPDGQQVVSASADDTARLWSVADGTLRLELRGHDDDVNSARFSADGAYVVTASSDHTARIWDAATGKDLATLAGHSRDVLMARFSPDGQRVVTASSDGTARIWDAATGETLVVLDGHEGDVHAAEFSPDGRYVVTASADGTARLWDAVSGADLAVLQPHFSEVKAARFSPDGQRVVTASDDARARLWQVRSFASFPELLAFAKQRGAETATSPWSTR
jgi:WD40 repeat protein